MLGEFGSGSPLAAYTRLAVAFTLKIAAATSMFFHLFTTSLLQAHRRIDTRLQVLKALSRIIMADHIALLNVLGTAFPSGLVTDIASQLLFFLGLYWHTPPMCDTPYMRITLKTISLLRPMSNKPGCILITTSAQFWLGVMPPLLLSVRRETTAALRFAERHGIPGSDRRVRVYTWLRRATSLTDPLAARAAACLAAAFAVSAAIAWQHLQRTYAR